MTFTAHLDNVVEMIQVLKNGGAHLDFRAKDGMTALHKAARSKNQVTLTVRENIGVCVFTHFNRLRVLLATVVESDVLKKRRFCALGTMNILVEYHMHKMTFKMFELNVVVEDKKKNRVLTQSETEMGDGACSIIQGPPFFFFSVLFVLDSPLTPSYVLILQTLLELGASPDYKDSRGLTPLYHSVVVGGDPGCGELLLNHRASVCCQDENGWHEIHQVYPHRRTASYIRQLHLFSTA